MNQILEFLLQPQIAFAQAKQVTDVASDVGTGTVNQIGNALTSFLTMIPFWIAGFFVIILSFVVAKIVKNTVETKLSEKGLEEEHKEVQIVAARSANAVVIVLGTTIGLKIAGLDLTPIIAAVAFGAGFAFQDIIKNFFAGLVILASRYYTIGDVIKVGGTVGKIEAIQTRATILKAMDGTRVVVPNANLFTNQVTSRTSNPTRKLTFVMGCGYDDDLKKVAKVTLDTIKLIPEILQDPKPKVTFYEWDDWEILFKIKIWVESKGGSKRKAKNKLIMKLTKAYNDADFNMPYPIQTNELTTIYNSPAKIDLSIDRLKANQTGDFYPENNSEEKIATPSADTKKSPKKQTSDFQIEFSPDSFKVEKSASASTKTPTIINPNPLATINSDASAWLKNALNQYQQPAPAKTETPIAVVAPAPVAVATEGYVEGSNALNFPPSPQV